MARPPDLRYAKGPTGHIAYQVFGEGPIDILPSWGMTASIQSYWDLPAAVRTFERLGQIGRLILFDRRGIGASDPGAPGHDVEAAFAEDASTVMDHAGADRVTVLGTNVLPVPFAVAVPDRVVQVVLVNPALHAREFKSATGADTLNDALWGDVDPLIRSIAPSAVDDRTFLDWYLRAGPQGASPSVAEHYWEWLLSFDVTDQVSRLRAPVTVVAGTTSPILPVEACRRFVDRCPDARLTEIPFGDVVPFTPAWPRALTAIEEAVTGRHVDVPLTRQLLTVVFTDLVASTARANEVGDERWRALLDRHDHLCARSVDHHGGALVKSTGDGHVSTFSSPTAAVRCAHDLVAALGEADLPARAGVHLGEVEVRGDDIGGVAVNLAARVCDVADSGSVFVTDAVRQATLGGLLDYEPTGTHELKGIPGSWALSRLT